MPLRSADNKKALALAALLAGLAPAAPADELGWYHRDQIAQWPATQQPLIPAWCHGTYAHPDLAPADPLADTEITADQGDLARAGEATLSGQVRVRQTGRELDADQARFNTETGDFLLEGQVRARTHELTLIADRIQGNTRQDRATVDRTRYAVHPLHARGEAERLEQQGRQLQVTQGSYTTCPPDSRAWSIHASEIRLDRDTGWGTARHTRLNVHGVPILYVPWFTFPIDDRRKTGLLFPSLSTGDDSGFDFSQPVYLNLHPQFDAIIAPRYIQRRGAGVDGQFRYLTRHYGSGTLSYGRIDSDRLFDDQSRELARWHHRYQRGHWYGLTDLNYVSDDFYFKDLDTGLDVRSQTHLDRLAQMQYWGPTWQFTLRLQGWQTIDPQIARDDLPYKRLPQLNLRGNPTLPGPLELDWVSDFTRFDRSTDLPQDNITGDRVHLQPAVSLPLRAAWGYLEPRLRLYHTRYRLDGVDTLPEDNPTRDLIGTSVDAGLFLERPLDWLGQRWLQTLEPRVFYNHVEYEGQDGLPNFESGQLTFGYDSLFRENRFTGYDRIGDEEKVSLGLTSRILSEESGRERLRLRAGQSVYLQDRRVQLQGRGRETAERSPLVTDATWYFGRYWHLFAETQWDTEDSHRERNGLRLGYADGQRRILHLGYHYRREDDLHQAELAAIWPVHRNWTIIGRWLNDVEHSRSLETMLGLEYRDCCVVMRVVGVRDLFDRDGDGTLDADRTIQFQIQLTGLGGFGGRIESLLRRSIPGYGSTYDELD